MPSTCELTLAAGGRTGVLLIHGLCGSPSEMRFIANGLSREGYLVSCPTLAGHGAGLDALRASTWHDWVESARVALKELARSCDRIVVAGLSTGALVALMLAAENPRLVSAVTLYSPTLWLNGSKVPLSLKIARKFLAFRAVAKHFDLPSPPNYGVKDERLRALLTSAAAKGTPGIHTVTPGVTALERRALVKAVISRLSEVRQPTLIVHPREDCLADLDNAFYLQKKLAGQTELVVLDDSYHLVTIDRQRQSVLEATVRFAGTVCARASLRHETGRATRPVGGLQLATA